MERVAKKRESAGIITVRPDDATLHIKPADVSEVLAEFVFCLGSFIDENNVPLMRDIMVVANMLRTCILQYGESYLGKRSSDSIPVPPTTETVDPNVRKDPSPEELIQAGPRVSNKFVVELFPDYLKQLKKKSEQPLHYIGKKVDQVHNLILLVKFYSNWLCANELTQTVLDINTEK